MDISRATNGRQADSEQNSDIEAKNNDDDHSQVGGTNILFKRTEEIL
jgi:hypothetical protein